MGELREATDTQRNRNVALKGLARGIIATSIVLTPTSSVV